MYAITIDIISCNYVKQTLYGGIAVICLASVHLSMLSNNIVK